MKNFELHYPWQEWLVATKLKKQFVFAKIDTGSSITMIGIRNAEHIGISREFILKQPFVRLSGVNENPDGYASQVPCPSFPVGNESLSVSCVYVPFEYVVEKNKTIKVKFTLRDKYLVGTDALGKYDWSLVHTGKPPGANLHSIKLQLTEHGFMLPARKIPTRFLYELVPKSDEITIESD
jgi:hypothetical protein